MTLAEPRPKRFTRSEYYRMTEAGLFDGQRVELIAGEVVQMPAGNNPHTTAVGLAQQALGEAFGKGCWVRIQQPLHLSGHSAPEPDLAVVRGSPRDFRSQPSTALLVVEVSESTLTYDQTVKSSLYARDGLADYWIVNLIDGLLEVYRNPVPDKSRRFGHRFASIATLARGESVAPLAAPKSVISVNDLLP